MRHLLFIFFLLVSFQSMSLTLRSDYPQRYVVQPGDTLWGIASRYLDHPWEWKELWHANPQIKNPKHLYAGAVLELHYYQKNPYLRVVSNGTIKLSPYVRRMHLEDPIPPVPLTDIKPFLNGSLVMNHDLLQNAPYVLAFIGEHMLGSQGDEVYVKNLHRSEKIQDGTTISYAIYRPGCPYLEPLTQRLLGYKATLVGYGELLKGGDPATILLTEIKEGIQIKDRVMLNDYPEFKLYFEPKTPLFPVRASIIDLPPVYTQGAVGLVAIIDRGEDAGIEVGDVLAIYNPRRLIPDLVSHQPVLLPRERLGELMIFRTFSQTSFGLVIRSTRTIHLRDVVTNP